MKAGMTIAVIGLGYVGAPLALELSKHFHVLGYDTNYERVRELRAGFDRNAELTTQVLLQTKLEYIQERGLQDATVFIVTVPTPISSGNVPDLEPVKAATRMIAKYIKAGDVVVYESTVYPGVTEEICVPILEQSGFLYPEQFNVGYSPERINPGDREHTLLNTTKIVSGDCEETLNKVDHMYSAIVQTYRAPCIRVAEGAKVVENIQRDVNIALMNELSQIFNGMGIDTNDVIDAAASKWNFQPFRPGLVGGHCISVDPYYLSHKAATQGFTTDVILSAREINDSMPAFIVSELIQRMTQHRLLKPGVQVTVLGVSFKENVPDIRNSKVVQIVHQLKKFGIECQLVDPIADALALKCDYGLELVKDPSAADAVILAVPHQSFGVHGNWEAITKYLKTDQPVILMDLKGVLPRVDVPPDLELWRP